MLRAIAAFLVGTSLLQPIAARAEAPTEAGARQVADAVETYGPDILSRPGLLRVSPDGEGYRIAFDTAKLVADILAPLTVKEATPVALGVSERPDGLWSFRSSGPFSLKAEHVAGGRTASLSLATADRTLSGEFDPTTIFPRSFELGLVKTELGLKDARNAIRVAIGDARVSSALGDLADGRADVDATFSMRNLSLTGGGFPLPETKISANRIDGTYRLDRFDLAGIAAMQRFWQLRAAGKEVETLTDAERGEARALLARHLPTMDAIGGSFIATGLATTTGGKGLRAGKFDYQSSWEGLAGLATLSVGARITDVGIDPGLWPKQLEPILPRDAAINVRATGFDMGAFWKDAAIMRTQREAALLPRDHLVELLLPGKKIVVEVNDSLAQSTFYDVAFSGKLDVPMERGKAPSGRFTVTARDFDGTIKYFQDNAKALPIFDRAAFFALMMKGLGKPGEDGALVWDVRFEETGSITVNGQPLPIRL